MSKKIPNRLRECRLKVGLKQIELARKLGIQSTNRISRWENGLSYPCIPNLLKLLEIFNVKLKDIYK